MSFFLRTSRFGTNTIARPSTSRTLMTSSVRKQKESDRHNPQQAEDNERHKQDLLTKHKDGKGHWKPELASDSEEAVQADRHAQDHTIEEMQKKTQDHAEKKHKYGTSQESGL